VTVAFFVAIPRDCLHDLLLRRDPSVLLFAPRHHASLAKLIEARHLSHRVLPLPRLTCLLRSRSPPSVGAPGSSGGRHGFAFSGDGGDGLVRPHQRPVGFGLGYRAAILCQVELETSEAWT